MTLISLANVNKYYNLDKESKEQALNQISLNIPKNKITAIYGPSGCGKSSLLNIISGLDRTYEGKLIFDGIELSGLSSEALTLFRRDNIGFVFQNFNLISHQSVLDNVKIPLYLKGLSEKEMTAIAEKILSDLDIFEFKKKNVKQLSGGQKQRVAIARALVNSPQLIIADEPTGALDSKSQMKVLEIFKSLVYAGKTLIVVTHNAEVADYADMIIKMKDGEVLETIQKTV